MTTQRSGPDLEIVEPEGRSDRNAQGLHHPVHFHLSLIHI